MEIPRALALFRFPGRVSEDELNTAFRNLVKKYHPDKVRDYPEWAHERMAEINDAYETLTAWINTPQKSREPNWTAYREERFQTTRSDTDNEWKKTAANLRNGFNTFLNGLELYYQYGLENRAYRNEGTRRFRLREALRRASRGRDILEHIINEQPSSRDWEHALDSAYQFAHLTVTDMKLGEPREGPPAPRRLDERFRAARRRFDSAVKEILFPNLLPPHSRGRAAAGLYGSYAVFTLYLIANREGSKRRKSALLMMARYDAFLDLITARDEGFLNF